MSGNKMSENGDKGMDCTKFVTKHIVASNANVSKITAVNVKAEKSDSSVIRTNNIRIISDTMVIGKHFDISDNTVKGRPLTVGVDGNLYFKNKCIVTE